MNDGYIQTKQRELNAKLEDIDRKTITFDNRLKTIERQIDDYGELIDKLKEIKNYKEKLKNDFVLELQNEFKTQVLEITKGIEKANEKVLSKHLNQLLQTTTNARIVIDGYSNEVNKVHKDFAQYISSFSELIMKLTEKRVITPKEAEEIMSKALQIPEEIRKKFDKNAVKIDKLFSKMGLIN